MNILSALNLSLSYSRFSERKRRMYDQYGHDGFNDLQNGGGGAAANGQRFYGGRRR